MTNLHMVETIFTINMKVKEIIIVIWILTQILNSTVPNKKLFKNNEN